jgi:hypothetical protein
MKSVNHIRSFLSTAVIILLLASIFCTSVAVFNSSYKTKDLVITKKTKGHTKSDTQLPYEEKEIEEEKGPERSNNHFFFICRIDALMLASVTESQDHSIHNPSHSCEHVAGIPLYLTQRSLII